MTGAASRSSPQPGPRSWLEDEPPLLAQGSSELGRLWRRALRHRRLALLVAVAFALLAGVYAARAPSTYSADVVLRISEGGGGSEVALAARELRRQILDVAFSAPKLIDLMKRLGMEGNALESDPQTAVESLREGISVKVWQQIYLAGGIERPTRVTVSYESGDRRLVLPVARGLAGLLVDNEARTRRGDLEARALTTAAAARRATADADRARRRETSGRVEAPAMVAADGAARARSVVPAAESRLREVQTAAVAAELRLRAAQESQELRFEIADDGREPVRPPSFLSIMTRVAVAATALTWPVWVLLFGAFNSRLTGTDDALLMGLDVLGSVPGSPAPGGVHPVGAADRSHV